MVPLQMLQHLSEIKLKFVFKKKMTFLFSIGDYSAIAILVYLEIKGSSLLHLFFGLHTILSFALGGRKTDSGLFRKH